MARRLMSRRGNSASQPQVTPYQQIELDDGWREWENTKQELVLVKRQLTEKDALILQLKTASRRLQETLRKKDKDLRAAFAILRSPQDAKTTKTRKQELVDRLVSECMQRAATSEALAEERRRELDRLKYSSKFLRFQELEVEIEECHTEIDRLRAKIETTAASSPPAIVGKLKVSAVPLTTNVSGSYTGTLVKRNKLEPLNLQEQESPDSRQNASATRINPTQSATGQVRVVPLTKYDHREGFVSKTRRRALEAEYYKQVRLAQLEVECELEENLHIRAAREAQRLEATERQEIQTDFIINSAGSQQSTSTNNNPGVEDVESADTTNKEATDVDKAEQPPEKLETVKECVLEEPATNTPEEISGNDGGYQEANMEVQTEKKTYEDGITDDTCKETDPGSVWNVDPNPHSNPEPYQNESVGATGETNPGSVWNVDPNPHSNPEPYQNENIGATGETYLGSVWNVDPNPHNSPEPYQNENVGATGETYPRNIWNVDPNPENNPDPYQNESNSDGISQSARDNGESNMKSATWNVDPDPSSSEKGGGETDRVIWNADPNPDDPDAPLDDVPVVYSDDEDDAHEAAEGQSNSVPSDDNNESTVWNLPPRPSLPTEETPEDPVASQEAEEDSVQEDSDDDGDNSQKEVWNADPTPTSYEHEATTSMTENSNVEHQTGMNQPVWNLDPEPVPVSMPKTALSPAVQLIHDDANGEISSEAAASTANEIVDADSSTSEDAKPVPTVPSSNTEYGGNPWNLEPKVSLSPPDSNTENGDNPWNLEPKSSAPASNNTDGGQSVDIPVHNARSAGELSSEPDTNTAWNLTPSVPETVSNLDSEGGNEEDNPSSVWNLDPHTGDASEPPDTFTVVTASELLQEDEDDVSKPQSTVKQLEMETPAESSGNYDDGTEVASNPSSAREYEDDATPEYTPPSTARDLDAGDEDPTW